MIPQDFSDTQVGSGRSTRAVWAEQSTWRSVRDYVRQNRRALTTRAAAVYPDLQRICGTQLLTTPQWWPAEPIPVCDLTTEFRDQSSGFTVTGRPELTASVRPRSADGTSYPSYSAAVLDLTAGCALQNRTTYRVVDALFKDGTGTLVFESGRYFDGIDIGDACAHELASSVLSGQGALVLRDAIGDPCDPARRPTNIAISTLTIRHDRHTGLASFFLQLPDVAKVGHTGASFHHVIPSGVFQASDDAVWNQTNDFSIWRCTVREFAEEMLDQPEDYGSDLAPIDYGQWPFAVKMEQALRDGGLRFFCLGMGVDPLPLTVDMMTVAVIDSDVFDDVFHDLVAENSEGSVLASLGEEGRSCPGIPFTEDQVGRLVHERSTLTTCAALLAAAWQARDTLLSW